MSSPYPEAQPPASWACLQANHIFWDTGLLSEFKHATVFSSNRSSLRRSVLVCKNTTQYHHAILLNRTKELRFASLHHLIVHVRPRITVGQGNEQVKEAARCHHLPLKWGDCHHDSKLYYFNQDLKISSSLTGKSRRSPRAIASTWSSLVTSIRATQFLETKWMSSSSCSSVQVILPFLSMSLAVKSDAKMLLREDFTCSQHLQRAYLGRVTKIGER